MEDLIKALTIFSKYKKETWPTHCEHDVLSIVSITKEEVSAADKKDLENLDFHYCDEDECWQSFRFGSA